MMEALRNCISEPPSVVLNAAEQLRRAVDCHNADDVAGADKLFRLTNSAEIRAWTESVWGTAPPILARPRASAKLPPITPPENRVSTRMPTAAKQRALIERDGYRCRFCGLLLVRAEIRMRISSAYPNAVPWGATNFSQHAALQAMWLQFDHVVPHAHGGTNRLANLVVTCAPCNFGKGHYTLEQIGLADPRRRPPERVDWNGLEDFHRTH